MIQKTRGIEWWKYYYDYENRLTKVEHFDGQQTTILGEYFYDDDGKRIKKLESSPTTIYIYLGWNIIYEKESSTMTETMRRWSSTNELFILGKKSVLIMSNIDSILC